MEHARFKSRNAELKRFSSSQMSLMPSFSRREPAPWSSLDHTHSHARVKTATAIIFYLQGFYVLSGRLLTRSAVSCSVAVAAGEHEESTPSWSRAGGRGRFRMPSWKRERDGSRTWR